MKQVCFTPSLTQRALCLFFAALFVGVISGCTPSDELPTDDVLTIMDSALAELGGASATGLTRGQRWRMISSVGAGLPPTNFDPSSLPEREARGAGLLVAYCIQCHAIPTPQMHAAAEWPTLVRRMALRALTLRDRMGGPLTRELVGDIRMSGFASSYIPSAEDTDSLVAYLQRNALPVPRPGELKNDSESRFYVEKCSLCHETPSPGAHTPAEWESVVSRMQTDMALMDVQPLEADDLDRINAFLEAGGDR